jgi:spore coat polysaccharide biosynthesis protein SpsF
MGSTRLPGKVLKLILGRPMLSYQIERLRRVENSQRVVVATTVNSADEPIVRFCDDEGIACTRGSEGDVLSRYYDAAQEFGASGIARITSDCPLIEPELIDHAISLFLGPDRPDYVSNMLEPSWPYGMAVEVMTKSALAEAHREAWDPAEREHVTPFIYRHPQRYRLESLMMAPKLDHHRWTVDTSEDLELVTRILESLYPSKPKFTMKDILCLLEEHPEWEEINAHVRQKSLPN